MSLTRIFLGSSLLLAACTGSAILGDPPVTDDDDAMDDDDATDDDDASGDADNDGDPDETDCDDEDPEVASIFDEVCGDGKDNDCDEETRCYSLRRGDDVHWIEPVRGDESAEAFYGYDDGASSAHGLEIADSFVVFLYQDPEDQLWFVTSIDGINDGSGGSVAADLSDLGGADIEVADDNSNEVYWDGEEIWFDFQWAGCCTDGAVVGPLDDDFCIEVDVLSGHEGLNGGLVVYDGSAPVDVGRADGRFDLCVED
jgi:hypothetical protein